MYRRVRALLVERFDLGLDALQLGVSLVREHLIDLTAHPGLFDVVPVRRVLLCERTERSESKHTVLHCTTVFTEEWYEYKSTVLVMYCK